MLEKGEVVDGKYEILSKIGEGGMSNVYLAVNKKVMKKWAIKEVRRDGVKDFKVVKQSLIAETDILKKLSHPNLPNIIDIIENEKDFLIVMDYIEGKTLRELLKERGALPEAFVIEWAKQLCDVLQYLHTRKPPIVYRDMKPSNIMLREDGTVCLIDFGTAREHKEKNLADTICLGTFGYAAPEQFGGFGQTDARTDIYCLGATLYHLATGINPADPPYEIQPIRKYNKTLSPALEEIILKCTQCNPDDRFQSCSQLKRALENIDADSYEYNSIQKKKFNTFLVSIIAALMCAAVGIGGLVIDSIQPLKLYNTISTLGFIMFGVCLAITIVVYFMLNIKKTYQLMKDNSSNINTVEDNGLRKEALSQIRNDMLSEDSDENGDRRKTESRASVNINTYNVSVTAEINDTAILNCINSGTGKFIITKNEMVIHTDKTL